MYVCVCVCCVCVFVCVCVCVCVCVFVCGGREWLGVREGVAGCGCEGGSGWMWV